MRPSVYLRQHRTKTIFCILCASCLHIFRHLAQFVLARRQPCCVLIVQSDEKSDFTICTQSLCGIALILYHRFSKKSSVILPRFFKVLHRHVFRQPYAVFRQIKHISVPCHLSAPYTVYERLAVSHTNLRCGFGIS